MIEKSLYLQYVQYPFLLFNEEMDELRKVVSEYPYCQTARMLLVEALKNTKSPDYKIENAICSLLVSKDCFIYDVSDNEIIDFIHKKESKELEAIKEFELLNGVFEHNLDTYKNFVIQNKERETEQETIIEDFEENIADQENITLDLKSEEEEKLSDKKPEPINLKEVKEKQNQLIDRFINKAPKITPKNTENKQNNIFNKNLASESLRDDKELMTETLTKLLMQQGKYERAIRAYEILKIKYPGKIERFDAQINMIKEKQNQNQK